jgi:hypothetical protein
MSNLCHQHVTAYASHARPALRILTSRCRCTAILKTDLENSLVIIRSVLEVCLLYAVDQTINVRHCGHTSSTASVSDSLSAAGNGYRAKSRKPQVYLLVDRLAFTILRLRRPCISAVGTTTQRLWDSCTALNFAKALPSDVIEAFLRQAKYASCMKHYYPLSIMVEPTSGVDMTTTSSPSLLYACLFHSERAIAYVVDCIYRCPPL